MTEIKVSFLDLQPRYQEEREYLLAIFDRTLASGHLVGTPEIADFEAEVVAFTGAGHCVSLNSGTDALMTALWGCGIGKGDEVITTPISFVATTGAIMHVGAVPVYVDVGEDQNIDVEKVEARITDKTKAIMPVHWGGRFANMAAISDIAERHGLDVIEDSAQSMGARYHGRHGGTMGRVGAVSCHPLKNLNAIGDSGFLLTDDVDLAEKVRMFRNHGLAGRDDCAFYGINSRMDVLNAQVLSYRLGRLQNVIAKRRHNANLYRELISAEAVFIPNDPADEDNSYVMFLVQAERRDELQAHLADNGIQALVYYGTPLHLHRAAADLGYRRGDLPVAENQADKVLALPHNQYLTDSQIAYVSECINAFYA